MTYAQLIDGKTGEQIEELDFTLETAMMDPVEIANRRNARQMQKFAAQAASKGLGGFRPPTPPPVRPGLRRAS